MNEMNDADDSFALHMPLWLQTAVTVFAEFILLIVTIGIIVAMWLPAYLSSRAPHNLGEHTHEEPMGMFPRGR